MSYARRMFRLWCVKVSIIYSRSIFLDKVMDSEVNLSLPFVFLPVPSSDSISLIDLSVRSYMMDFY